MSRSDGAGLRVLSLRARIVVTALLVIGVGGLVFAFAGLEPDEGVPVREGPVRVVFPAAGDQMLRQGSLFVELDPAFTGRLEALLLPGGREVDIEEDTDYLDGLNRYSYTPDADSPTGELKPGRHCARVYYWRVGEAESTGRSHSWCFSVH